MKKLDQTALLEPLTMIRHLAEMLDDGLLLLDSKGVVLSANRAVVKMFENDFVGKLIFDFFKDKSFAKAFQNTIMKRDEQKITYLPKNDLVQREFILSFKRLGDEQIAVLFRDMTRQKNIENVRRDFVANVSHELRSPLTSLAGFIETMRGDNVPDEAMRERFLNIMEEEAKRMSRLIDDLLSLSRVEVDEHILPDNEIRLLDVISSVIDSLSERASQRGMKITLVDKRVNKNLKPKMHGSFDEITQVFVNIIENAIKYSFEKTGIEICIFELSANRLQIDVINQGEGIEEAHLTRLTERFYRIDKARSRQIGGTGLGLAIVKHIVNRHRGSLSIASKINETTKFSVELPVIFRN